MAIKPESDGLSHGSDDEILNGLRRAASMHESIAMHFGRVRDAAGRLAAAPSRLSGLTLVPNQLPLSVTIAFVGRRIVLTACYDGVTGEGRLDVLLDREGRSEKEGKRIHSIPFHAGNGSTNIKVGAEAVSLANDGDCYSLVARCVELALRHDPL